MESSWKTKTIPSEDSRMSNSQYLKPFIPGFAEDSRNPSRVFSKIVPEAPSLCPEFFILALLLFEAIEPYCCDLGPLVCR